jgi:hypothetical protein
MRKVNPISKAGITIWEVLTPHIGVMIFVESKNLENTYSVLYKLFMINA